MKMIVTISQDTKQCLRTLINYYVEILLIQVYSKIYDHFTNTRIVIKKLLNYFFFKPSIRMSENNVNFGNKKIKKVAFTRSKKQRRQMTLMLIKYQSLEKNYVVQKNHLNTLLDIIKLLDYYA